MTEQEFYEFAKQVEADLVAHDPTWAEYPFGTEQGLLDQYYQTYYGVGTIFYYVVATVPTTGEKIRTTVLLDQSQLDSPSNPPPIDPIDPPIPPDGSNLVYYGAHAPDNPKKSPIWFDTDTGDIRIWYDYEGGQTWVNTGVAGIGKIEFLNDLQDVDVLTTPVEDLEHLQFNAADGKWYPYDLHGMLLLSYSAIDHEHTIVDLTDTLIVDPIDNDVIQYEGGSWKNKSFESVNVWYGSTAPASPEKNPIWFNTNTGFTAIHYNDGDSSQWIDIGGSDSRVDASAEAHSFLARLATQWNITSVTPGNDTWLVIPFQTGTGLEVYDTSTNFNNATNRFIAPVSGIYHFDVAVRIDNLTHTTYFHCDLTKNGVQAAVVSDGGNESYNYMYYTLSVRLQVAAGDYFQVRIYSDVDNTYKVITTSWFSGGLVHAT